MAVKEKKLKTKKKTSGDRRLGLGVGMCMALVFPVNVSAMALSEYVADSISAHPNVREKVHIFRQVERDHDIANSGWRPSIDLVASTGEYETESPLTGSQKRDYDSNQAELSITQNLFNGFNTTHQLAQARARIRSALFDLYDTADNVALDAVQAYLDVLKQQKLYKLAQENVKAHETILSQIRERSRSGVGRRSQLEQTEGRLARAQASLIAQQNNLQDATTRYHEVLGRYVQLETLAIPELPAIPSGSLDELIDAALRNHPAMRVAAFNIEAAQSDYQRSKSNNYPQLDLRLAKETGSDINGLVGDTDETSVVLNLRYNLYRGGADVAEQRKKVSIVHEQQQFAARVRRQVINTLRLAWVADQSLAHQLKYLATHINKARETVASYQEEFFIGQRDLLDLLDAKNELNTAQNQHAEAYFQALAARYRIHEGVGTLFDALQLETKVEDEDFQVVRIQARGEDKLPLNPDLDADKKQDNRDHCDNTLPNDAVSDYGCKSIQQVSIGYTRENVAPRPGNDFYELEQNGVLILTQAMLLKNDVDDNGDTLSIVDFTQPAKGKLARNRDKNLIYRAPEGYAGIERFNYTVSDGNGAVASAMVQITIPPESDINLSKTQYVNFQFGKAELTPVSKTKLVKIINKLKKAGSVNVDIYAYTDNIGSDSYNLALSKRRATAMRKQLLAAGIQNARIKAYGKGEKDPIADNSTPEGQAINRRGEFRFSKVNAK